MLSFIVRDLNWPQDKCFTIKGAHTDSVHADSKCFARKCCKLFPPVLFRQTYWKLGWFASNSSSPLSCEFSADISSSVCLSRPPRAMSQHPTQHHIVPRSTNTGIPVTLHIRRKGAKEVRSSGSVPCHVPRLFNVKAMNWNCQFFLTRFNNYFSVSFVPDSHLGSPSSVAKDPWILKGGFMVISSHLVQWKWQWRVLKLSTLALIETRLEALRKKTLICQPSNPSQRNCNETMSYDLSRITTYHLSWS